MTINFSMSQLSVFLLLKQVKQQGKHKTNSEVRQMDGWMDRFISS